MASKHRAEDRPDRHTGNPRQPNKDGMYPHGDRKRETPQNNDFEDRGNNDPNIRRR